MLAHEDRVERREGDVVVDAVVAGDERARSGWGRKVAGEEVFGVAVDVVAGEDFGPGLAGPPRRMEAVFGLDP